MYQFSHVKSTKEKAGVRNMRNVVEILDELQTRAGKDPDLRKQLLGTRLESDPVSAELALGWDTSYMRWS